MPQENLFMDSVFEKIVKIIVDVVNPGRIKKGLQERDVTDYARLGADLGIDSLEFLEICQNVEEEFDIVLSDDDKEIVQTVGDLVEAVKRLCPDEK